MTRPALRGRRITVNKRSCKVIINNVLFVPMTGNFRTVTLKNCDVLKSHGFQSRHLNESMIFFNMDVLRVHEHVRLLTKVVNAIKLDVDIKVL
jgi:hypothetical protein